METAEKVYELLKQILADATPYVKEGMQQVLNAIQVEGIIQVTLCCTVLVLSTIVLVYVLRCMVVASKKARKWGEDNPQAWKHADRRKMDFYLTANGVPHVIAAMAFAVIVPVSLLFTLDVSVWMKAISPEAYLINKAVTKVIGSE